MSLIIGSNFDFLVSSWLGQVETNGGTKNILSNHAAKIRALNDFCYNLRKYSFFSKIKVLNTFFPECSAGGNPLNLVSLMTPLISLYGNNPWTNYNFVVGDASATGLKGNGISKYIQTAINPFTCFSGNSSAGITLYYSECTAAASQTEVFASSSLSIKQGSANSLWDMYMPLSRITYSTTGFTGYVSLNRTSLTQLDLYRASSSFSHAKVGTSTSPTAGRPNSSLILYANSIPAEFSARTLSFFAVTDGLTITESADFYNLIQTLRMAYGGGYV